MILLLGIFLIIGGFSLIDEQTFLAIIMIFIGGFILYHQYQEYQNNQQEEQRKKATYPAQVSNTSANTNNKYNYVGVRFINQASGCYYYLTNDNTIKMDDKVEVPTQDGIKKATVVFVRTYFENDAKPYPVNQTKYIIGKVKEPSIKPTQTYRINNVDDYDDGDHQVFDRYDSYDPYDDVPIVIYDDDLNIIGYDEDPRGMDDYDDFDSHDDYNDYDSY